jgi:GTP-binding protein
MVDSALPYRVLWSYTINSIARRRWTYFDVVRAAHQHGVTSQDLRIADLVQREGRALVLGMNKWDLMEGKHAGKLRAEADHWLPQVKGVPIVAVSGRLGEGLDRLMQGVVDAHEVWNRRVATNRLNRWFEDAVSSHPPPVSTAW